MKTAAAFGFFRINSGFEESVADHDDGGDGDAGEGQQSFPVGKQSLQRARSRTSPQRTSLPEAARREDASVLSCKLGGVGHRTDRKKGEKITPRRRERRGARRRRAAGKNGSFFPASFSAKALGVEGLHWIAQHPDALDADLDSIAGDERADARRRAGGDEIAGLESHHAGNPADNDVGRKKHQRSAAGLANRAV